LLELLVSTLVLTILIAVIGNFVVDRWADYIRNDSQIIIQSNTKIAIETMELDIKAANGIEDANFTPDPNHSTWSSGAGVLVLKVPAQNSGGQILFVNGDINSPCVNDVIYYLSSGGALYRRWIPRINPAECNANAITLPTCPPSGGSGCSGTDAKIIENVADLAIRYYDNVNPTTELASPPYAGSGSIQITLGQSLTRFGKTFTGSLTSRVNLRNK
jgi:hypothetical protein